MSVVIRELNVTSYNFAEGKVGLKGSGKRVLERMVEYQPFCMWGATV
jgi:hypothetical protein